MMMMMMMMIRIPHPKKLRCSIIAASPSKEQAHVFAMGASLQVMKDARTLLAGGQTAASDVLPCTGQLKDTEAIDPGGKQSTRQKYPLDEAPSAVIPPATSIESSEDRDKVALLKFEDVDFPLRTAGFVFRRNLYCRPGMDPKKNSSAVLGRDYFTTEKSFRKNLCAYGVEDCEKWRADTCQAVVTWIRYSIARSLDSKTHIPILPNISGIKAWSLLGKLGFRHRYTNLLSIYRFPGVEEGEDGILGKTKFIDEEREFYTRLSRFGLPDACSYDQITENERIRLESFLAEKGRILTL
jgi:hypothetical protein